MMMWFLNECGEPYPYDEKTQADEFPNDFHTPYHTEKEAIEASERQWAFAKLRECVAFGSSTSPYVLTDAEEMELYDFLEKLENRAS